ncbi:hypothetical protein ACFQ6V_26275 [Streptomyces roseifaciens]
MNQTTATVPEIASERTGRLPHVVSTPADPARVTPASVQAEIAALILDRARAYAVQDDDGRLARIRAFDISHAAEQGAEDAAVQLDHENQTADPRCQPRSDMSNRFNNRLGRMIGRDLDALLQACAANAAERGDDPEKAVVQLAGILSGYLADAAHAAIKAAR